jgi:DNA-binding LytR/AlgR family response regulator
MTISALIVDDEAAARSRLRKLLQPFPDIVIRDEARDGVEAVQLIVRTSPDLVFLDVQMPGLDGFEALRSLPRNTSWPLVIFTTAFDRYALQAFEANAVGYLMKPINRDKLAAAIVRATQLLAAPRDASQARERLRSLADATRQELRQIVGRFRDRFVLVPATDACVLRMEDELVKVKTETALYRTDYTMADLEARLPSPPFLRVHRAALVNMNWVKEAVTTRGACRLVLKDREKTEIQVSERQLPRVRAALGL